VFANSKEAELCVDLNYSSSTSLLFFFTDQSVLQQTFDSHDSSAEPAIMQQLKSRVNSLLQNKRYNHSLSPSRFITSYTSNIRLKNSFLNINLTIQHQLYFY
jgi:hypothetical protein